MEYSGMTVNERLVVSGLIKQFDDAKKRKDKEAIIDILERVEIDKKSIDSILKEVGLYSTSPNH